MQAVRFPSHRGRHRLRGDRVGGRHGVDPQGPAGRRPRLAPPPAVASFRYTCSRLEFDFVGVRSCAVLRVDLCVARHVAGVT